MGQHFILPEIDIYPNIDLYSMPAVLLPKLPSMELYNALCTLMLFCFSSWMNPDLCMVQLSFPPYIHMQSYYFLYVFIKWHLENKHLLNYLNQVIRPLTPSHQHWLSQVSICCRSSACIDSSLVGYSSWGLKSQTGLKKFNMYACTSRVSDWVGLG